MQSVNNVNQITGDALGSNYRYDADGNTTAYNIYVPPSQAPGGVISNSLTYDDEGRLTSFNNTSVGYRPDGLRGWANGHYYFYAGGKLLYETLPTGWIEQVYGWGADGIEQVNGVEWFGNPSLITYQYDPQGNTVSHQAGPWLSGLQQFDAFGNQLFYVQYTGNPPGVSPLFPGQYAAPPTSVEWGGQWGAYSNVGADLVLMTHRYYSPTTGRFITRDPIGYEGGLNEYAYTRNNPIMRGDPSGLDPDDDDDGCPEDTLHDSVAMKPFLKMTNRLAKMGTNLCDFLAGLNPIANVGTAITGKNAVTNESVSKWQRGLALAAAIPGISQLREVEEAVLAARAAKVERIAKNSSNGSSYERAALASLGLTPEAKTLNYGLDRSGNVRKIFLDNKDAASKFVTEVKGGLNVTLTPQLHAMIDFSKTAGAKFRLIARHRANISKPLQDLIRRVGGSIKLFR